jgi:probable addiction module antidote protein
MAKTKTRPWEAAEHLETGEDMALYLEAALDDGGPALAAAPLGDIARAKGLLGSSVGSGENGPASNQDGRLKKGI